MQFIFSASICCVIPISAILFDMAKTICREHFSQSLTSCSIFTRCSFTLVCVKVLLSIVVFMKIILHLILRVQNYTKTMSNTTFWLYFCRLKKKNLVLYVFLPNNPISHMHFLLTRGKRSVPSTNPYCGSHIEHFL